MGGLFYMYNEMNVKIFITRFITRTSLIFLFLTVIILMMSEVHDVSNNTSFGRDIMPEIAGPKFYRIKKHPKKKHIYFLRTHKSGSTTIYSMFLRFGYVNNLTFVLPPNKRFPGTISTKPFQKGKGYFLPPPQGETYDILCHHTTYNRSGVEEVLPKDTIYIGLLREPLAQFVSAFMFYSGDETKQLYLSRIPGKDISSSISTYLKNPAYYEPKTAEGKFKWSYTNNGMAVDFGFPPEDLGNVISRKINRFIRKIDAEFDLVIILEYLDESLVLMKRILNWSLKDVLYLGRRNKARSNPKEILSSLTAKDRSRHKRWESVDFALYNHFLKKLLKTIQNQDESFQREVEDLRTARIAVAQFCENQIVTGKFVYTAKDSKEQIVINSFDCMLFGKSNYDLNRMLKLRKVYPKTPTK